MVGDSADDGDASVDADELLDEPSEGVCMFTSDTEGSVEPEDEDEGSTEPETWPLTERSEERVCSEEAVVV